jgi:hypothetical protein
MQKSKRLLTDKGGQRISISLSTLQRSQVSRPEIRLAEGRNYLQFRQQRKFQGGVQTETGYAGSGQTGQMVSAAIQRARVIKEKKYNPYEVAASAVKSYEKEKQYAEDKRHLAYLQKQEAYKKTFAGRTGSRISKGFSMVRPGGMTSWGYGSAARYKTQPKASVSPGRGGGRGRPKGTYDTRYAKYGGVYGYRKVLAQQLRERRMQMQRQSQISPEQEQALAVIQARQQMQRANPERQVFPDTNGAVDMAGYNNDINNAVNLVD